MDKEKYIEEQFEKWRKCVCYNPFGIDKDNFWIAKSFALWIINNFPDYKINKEKI